MTASLVLVLVVGVLFATGTILMLERSLSRVVLGTVLLANGVNALLLVAGRAGGPPIVGENRDRPISDPLPQAMVLTAIVISLGVTAFLVALAYRSWQLLGHDEVQDDIEDRRVARMAERGRTSGDEVEATGDDIAPAAGEPAAADHADRADPDDPGSAGERS